MIQACKIYNQVTRAAAQHPERALRVEGLSLSNQRDLTKALFDSKMQTAGFKTSEYKLSLGYKNFRGLFDAKGIECWWPRALDDSATYAEEPAADLLNTGGPLLALVLHSLIAVCVLPAAVIADVAHKKARTFDESANPPFPHNGIKSLPSRYLLQLYHLLENLKVQWRDVLQRLQGSDSCLLEFIHHRSGQSLATQAAAQPENAAFTINPSVVHVSSGRADDDPVDPLPGVPTCYFLSFSKLFVCPNF